MKSSEPIGNVTHCTIAGFGTRKRWVERKELPWFYKTRENFSLTLTGFCQLERIDGAGVHLMKIITRKLRDVWRGSSGKSKIRLSYEKLDSLNVISNNHQLFCHRFIRHEGDRVTEVRQPFSPIRGSLQTLTSLLRCYGF